MKAVEAMWRRHHSHEPASGGGILKRRLGRRDQPKPAIATATAEAGAAPVTPGVKGGEAAEQFTLSVEEATRLMRLEGTLGAVVSELRSLPEGSIPTTRLSALVGQLVSEADSVLPSASLAELHRLIKTPVPGNETGRNLRLVLVGLQAWLDGLGAQLQMVVVTPEVPRGTPAWSYRTL
jgi:hypothetical protein